MKKKKSPFENHPLASETIRIGDALLQKNSMTGDWMVSGQKGAPSAMYACRTLLGAKSMAKTINHHNSTGEIKHFKKEKV